MRLVQNPPMQRGEIDILAIEFDPKSRDDIPKLLMGLQHIYTQLPTRNALFALLEKEISPQVDKNNGRPGIFNDAYYHFQTLRDNVCLLTPELLDKINQLVVNAGHELVAKKGAAWRGHCVAAAIRLSLA